MKTKTPSLVTIAVLTTITVIFWLFFNIYRVFKKVPPTVVPEEILKPLENLNPSSLDELNKRLYFSDFAAPQERLVTPSPEASPEATPEATTTPEATGSASPSPLVTP